jgi:hypothetical protein
MSQDLFCRGGCVYAVYDTGSGNFSEFGVPFEYPFVAD